MLRKSDEGQLLKVERGGAAFRMRWNCQRESAGTVSKRKVETGAVRWSKKAPEEFHCKNL